jgi:hypothetical protein
MTVASRDRAGLPEPARARPVTPEHAAAFVRARLGRPPQDAIEAAVVLEAWGGMGSERALELGRRILAEAGRPSSPDRDAPRSPPDHLSMRLVDHVGLVLIVALVAAWSESLASQLDARTVQLGWKVGLPLSLALQWTLRRRYLTSGERLGVLRRATAFVVLSLGSMAISLPIALGAGGAMAALLAVIWTGSTIVAMRGWALPVGAVLAAAAWLGREAPALEALGAVAGATFVVCVIAVATSPVDPAPPAPWRHVLPAGLVGAGFGLILASDPGVRWGIGGALPVLAYLPSFVGGQWASVHLRRIWEALPGAARNVTIEDADRGSIAVLPALVIGGALLRLGAAVAPLSALVLAWVDWQGGRIGDALGILVGFSTVASASVAVALLESCNEKRWMLLAVLAGCLVALALRAAPAGAVPPGGVLTAGASVVVLLAAPSVLQLVRRPGRKLATSMFIP